MAKGKYLKWLEDDNLLRLEAWARDGLTDEQIAINMGVTRKTLYTWKEQHLPILHALKKGKEVVDVEVENSLLKKAMGFKTTVRKAFKVKEVIYDEGKRLSEKEHIEYAEEDVYFPPDTTAQIFWLKNRRPDKWKDRPIDKTPDGIADISELYDALDGDCE